MRHGWLAYPDTAAAQADLQYFLGEHLLVAPVTQEGAGEVAVTFPPGDWEHVLTGETYAGDQQLMVPAPLGQPTAFVRQGDSTGEEILAALQSAGVTSQ